MINNILNLKNKIARWLKNRDFSRINAKSFKKIMLATGAILFLALFFVCFEVYVPLEPMSNKIISYRVEKGASESKIADDLQDIKIIRSAYFFKIYTALSLQREKLQAGRYQISPKMSAYQIAKQMALGNSVNQKVVIFEGDDTRDIGKKLELAGLCDKDEFVTLAKQDYSKEFDFLLEKPKNVGLEGYLFPDTYEISLDETCEDFLIGMLSNFDKKVGIDLRSEAEKQKKSLFDIIRMASIIEKEVRHINEKKIVSGILWKRIAIGMPLQVDCTINYITDKSDASARIRDTKIDSPYNTYLYPGLPKGAISNPGVDSILAAIYPQKSNYLFYLSSAGKTYFSQTFDEHVSKKGKYLY